MPNVLNEYPSDGESTSFEVSMLDGYLDRDYVKFYIRPADSLLEWEPYDLPVTWVGPYTFTIQEPIPSGTVLVCMRETSRNPIVDFENTSRITERNLNTAFKQSLHRTAELEDWINRSTQVQANAATLALAAAQAAADSALASASAAQTAEGLVGAAEGAAQAAAGSAADAVEEAQAATETAEYALSLIESATKGNVDSFNGRDGSVVPESGDYTPDMVGFNLAGALTTTPSWDTIPSWEDPTLNGQAQALANRTEFIKSAVLSYPDYQGASSAASTLPDGQVVNVRSNLTSYTVVGVSLTNPQPVTPFTAVGGVTRSAQEKLAEGPSPLDFGAVGDGATNDTAAFAALDSAFSEPRVIDLAGKTYVIDAPRVTHTYVNGSFILSDTAQVPEQRGTELPSDDSPGMISGLVTTGAVGTAYSGGVNNTPTVPGRSTRNRRVIVGSQGCRADFNISGNYSCIYSWAYGNVSANLASRQSVAGCPQAINLAAEEGQIYGFGGANINNHFSVADGTKVSNISTRLTYAAGARYAVNIASVGSRAGGGWGAVLTPKFTNGVLTDVTIESGGQNYGPINGVANTMVVTARQAQPTSPAVLTFSTHPTSGAITSVTIVDGGSGYTASAMNDIRVQLPSSGPGEVAGNYSTVGARAHGFAAANIATGEVINRGETSIIAASSGGSTTGAAYSRQAVIASTDGKANQAGAFVLSGTISEANHVGSGAVGRRLMTAADRTLVLGDGTSGGASTANRKIQLGISSGNISASGTVTGSSTFTDYAEYFENLEPGVIPLGMIVTLEGRKVRPAQPGDNILGVVSATALIMAGDSPFAWAQRYLTGEFGESLYHDVECVRWESKGEGGTSYDGTKAEALELFGTIPDHAVHTVEHHQIENPAYDPELANVPRSERPDEWTCVGLLGQVHVRVSESVTPGQYVAAGVDGVGLSSESPTNMICMEVRREFDAVKGYAVALCLIR